jgi:membrane associated rhomboid family serine protease
MPAWVSIGVWFLFQLVAGIGLLGGGSQAGGVAYAAHVGGFVAGLILVKMFAVGQTSR